MSIDRLITAADRYLSVRRELDERAVSYVGREAELEEAKASLARVMDEYIAALGAEVESLQHALSASVYRLNRLKALNNRLQARAAWSGEDLSRLLQTLAELERRE